MCLGTSYYRAKHPMAGDKLESWYRGIFLFPHWSCPATKHRAQA